MPKVLLVLVVASAAWAALVVTAPSREPLTVRDFSFSPSSFAVPTSPSERRATVMQFELSAPATIRIGIARGVIGRRSGGWCLKATRRLRNHRTCVRYADLGKIVRAGVKRGRIGVPFSGRLHGKALKPGGYRATIVAVGRDHRHGQARRASFTVVPAGGTGQEPTGANPTSPGQEPTGANPTSPSPPSASTAFPNLSNTGVPTGWVPKQTFNGLTVSQPGQVIEDVEVNGDVNIDAPNVTLRRVLVQGGFVDNMRNGHCGGNGLVVEDSTFTPPGGPNGYWTEDHWQIGQGGYTLRRVQALGNSDGPRAGGNSLGCGPVTISDSFISIAPPNPCTGWHGDGIQGDDSAGLTIQNVTIDHHHGGGDCGGNAGFFYPGGIDGSPNAHADINRLLIRGGNWSFRMGTPGSVQALKLVENAWEYGPIAITDSGCSVISPWDASIVTITSDFQVARTVRSVPCS